MDQRIVDLYDAFTHGAIDRRAFVDRLAMLAGSAAAGLVLVQLIQANPAAAALVVPDDARLEAATIAFPGSGAGMSAYVAKPAGGTNLPAVLVIHENRGLNPHTQDVARRMALEGFLVLAPDFLAPIGGTPADEDKAREMIGALDADETVANAVSAAKAGRTHPDGNGKVGVVGFCWGGGMANNLAVADPRLGAAVAYYGRQPEAAHVPMIEAPLLLHYAGLDDRINAGIAAYEEALKANGKAYTIHLYEGVNHAFNNDTSAERYNAEAAALAWQRTVDFLRRHLA